MKKFALIVFFLFAFISFYIVRTSTPTVSVIMPTYNREGFLPRSIESILRQSYTDFEFIIVDDGSTDNSWQLLNQYAHKDKRIRLIRNKKNAGVSFSREIGMLYARGKYIAIMDSDDVSLSERLEKQVAYMEKNPHITVVIGLTQNVLTGRMWHRTQDPQEIIYEMHFDNVIGNPQTMIRHSFLIENNIHYKMNYRAAEDYDFFKQIIFAGGRVSRTNDVVLAIRYHSDNPKSYYMQQLKNRATVSKEFLKRYGIDWSGASKPTCDLITRMVQNNTAGLLSDAFLESKKNQICQSDNE